MDVVGQRSPEGGVIATGSAGGEPVTHQPGWITPHPVPDGMSFFDWRLWKQTITFIGLGR